LEALFFGFRGGHLLSAEFRRQNVEFQHEESFNREWTRIHANRVRTGCGFGK
jgi:hypothetical protein